MTVIVFWLALCFAMAAGVPVAFALAMSGFAVALLFSEGLTLQAILTVFSQRMFAGTDSFVLLALPLFFLAGALMEAGGISDRLVRFAMVLVGWIRGGLSMVAVVTSMFFSGISGAASADAAAVGGVLIPAMRKRGYSAEYAAAITASSGALGPIIPPSILLVVYGGMADVSIAKLFLGGIVPGIIFGAALLAVCAFIAVRRGYPREAFPSLADALIALRGALIPLAGPAIILGGIFGGIFTATESAMVAVLYGLVVSVFVYRSLTWAQVMDIFVESVVGSARVMVIIATASFVGWVLAREQIPQQIATTLLSISTNPLVILLLVNGLLLVFGCFLEALAITVVLLPTLLPILKAAGIDIVFFGVIMMINLAIGTVTPPVGTCLFVASAIAGVPMERILPELWPFILIMVAALGLLIVYPPLVLWLPNLVG